jgi:uncharacterized protein YjbJ (UPF0337 family)
MGEATDKFKGNVKETAGDVTGNDRLKHEGQADQASGKVKGAVDDVKDAAENTVDKVKDKLHRD